MQGSGFDLLPCSGSYFICGTYSRVSDESAMNLAVSLTKKIGVATIPVSSLYHDGHDDKVLRFCFAKKEETLIEAAKRLQSFG
jgi:methionine transaminase